MARTIEELLPEHPPISVRTDDTVLHATEAMNANSVGSVIVYDHQRELVGIFTERDVLTRVIENGLSPASTMVVSVMTPMPVVADRRTTVQGAAALVHAHGVSHLPVVDGTDVLGIVSLRDLRAEALGELAEENRALRGYIDGSTARAADSHF